jgi:hypothetical protein
MAVAKAVLLMETGTFVVVLATMSFASTRIAQTILGLIAAVLSVAFPTWWMHRKLQTVFTRREARAVVITFAVSGPFLLALSMPFGFISGGAGEVVFNSRLAAGLGAFLGVAVVCTVLCFLTTALALSVTKQTVKMENQQQPR